jgi:hypothetical protein
MDVSSPEFSPEAFAKTYDVFRLVHLRKVRPTSKADDAITWQSLSSTFQTLDANDKKTWCVETNDDLSLDLTPVTFLNGTDNDSIRAYCSFLIQSDKAALNDTLERLPVRELNCLKDCSYENALWIFFGRNPSGDTASNLNGRTEHTDSVSHDGTWHYQLSGRKTWVLRPSPEMKHYLDQHFVGKWDESKRLTVTVEQGEVLVINTRLWFHQTIIPPQKTPSVSYARDFRFASNNDDDDDDDDDDAMSDHDDNGNGEVASASMKNVDGLYATTEIEASTILFRESEMPSCELHRAASLDDANCEVVELEDGTCAVVSRRRIAAGEFFCIPESDDEADVDFDEEEELNDDEVDSGADDEP